MRDPSAADELFKEEIAGSNSDKNKEKNTESPVLDSIPKDYLGRRMGAFRKQATITQEQMSKACGISKVNISKMERGEHKPSAQSFLTYCRVLGISPAEMAGDCLEHSSPIVPELFEIIAAMPEHRQRILLRLIREISFDRESIPRDGRLKIKKIFQTLMDWDELF